MIKFFLLLPLSLVLILSSCTRKEEAAKTSTTTAIVKVKLEETKPEKDRVLARFARTLEQADSVHREAWWVVAAERKVQGKSLFGKLQRALVTELGEKLASKSLFSCDRYFVKREILAVQGVPQKGQVIEKCTTANNNIFAEYEIRSATQIFIVFYPQYLSDVVGVATSILNRKIRCTLESSDEGKLEKMQCENMAQDRNATQSIQFSEYRYQRAGKNLITLKGEVYENLSSMRKIEAQVPMEGKISVVETQVEAPEGYILKSAVKPLTPPVPAAKPEASGHQLAAPPTRDVVPQNQPESRDHGPAPTRNQHGDLPQVHRDQETGEPLESIDRLDQGTGEAPAEAAQEAPSETENQQEETPEEGGVEFAPATAPGVIPTPMPGPPIQSR